MSTRSVNKPTSSLTTPGLSLSHCAACTSWLGDSWKEGAQRNSSIVHRSGNKDAGSRPTPTPPSLLPNDRAPVFLRGKRNECFPAAIVSARRVFNAPKGGGWGGGSPSVL